MAVLKGDTGERGKTGERGPSSRKGLIGYLILVAFVVFALFQGWESDQHACQLANENRQIMRVILKDSNERTQTSKQRSVAEKKAAQEFYQQLLSRIPPVKC